MTLWESYILITLAARCFVGNSVETANLLSNGFVGIQGDRDWTNLQSVDQATS
jgi:hypothetical protein